MDPKDCERCRDTRQAAEVDFSQLLKVEFAVCFTVDADARVLDVKAIHHRDEDRG
jgi:hypothetical protein